MRPNPNIFAGNPLDRANIQRKDEGWIAAQRAHADARLLPVHEGSPLTLPDRDGDGRRELGWLTFDALKLLPRDREPVLLGLDDGIPCWAVDATEEEPLFGDLGEHISLRKAVGGLSAKDASIAGQAVWLIDWHARHRFCARYGDETTMAEAGLKRINPRTGTEHFPRTDPVAIVLPLHEGAVCLGRSPHFPPGMFSALAGFMEACETLEECAAREVHEEVGLVATDIEYIFSQPWPFPSSLMAGFFVGVEGRELTLDPTEIEEARWFTRDEIAGLLAGEGPEGVFCPPPFAIAHQLMREWIARG